MRTFCPCCGGYTVKVDGVCPLCNNIKRDRSEKAATPEPVEEEENAE